MFLAIILIILGLFLLLNAMGIIVSANFWGFFWAVIFLAIGFRLLSRRGKCPMCSSNMWKSKIHNKINNEYGHNHPQNEEEDEDEDGE